MTIRKYFFVLKKWQLGLGLTLMGLVFSMKSVLADIPSPRVETWIQNQQIIRVYMPDWEGILVGLGNQTKSYNLMLRLWELGFEGTFELIYPYSSHPGFSVLFNLPTEFDSNQDHYHFEYMFLNKKRKITFIPVDTYYEDLKNNQASQVDLAVGGYMPDSPPCGRITISLEDRQKKGVAVDFNSPFCKNLANFANAKTFLRFDRSALSPVFSAVYLSTLNQPHEVLLSGNNKQFFLSPTIHSLTQVTDYLLQDPRGQAFLAEKPALKTLMEGIEAKKFNFLPVYGYTIGTFREDDKYQFPANILQIIAGARFAQLTLNQSTAALPVIIGVFYDYSKEAPQLASFINTTASFDDIEWYTAPNVFPLSTPAELNTELTQAKKNLEEVVHSPALKLKGNFIVANLDDLGASDIINKLEPGKILLLSVGQLPKPVFDGLYTHTNTNIWPQVREGLSSFDSLLTTGKPHLRCFSQNGAWELGLDNIQDESLKLLFQKLYGDASVPAWQQHHAHFCGGMESWSQDSNLYQDFGQFILDATHPETALSHYFAQLKADALNPESDAIYQALEQAYAETQKPLL